MIQADEVERAFPVSDRNITQFGMPLRDYFAAKALAALIGYPEKDDVNRGGKAVNQLAAWAYDYADAMMREREE